MLNSRFVAVQRQAFFDRLWANGKSSLKVNLYARSRTRAACSVQNQWYSCTASTDNQNGEQLALVKGGGELAQGRRRAMEQEVERLYMPAKMTQDMVVQHLSQRIQYGSSLAAASFEHFPYYLDPAVKEHLMLCTGLHLNGKVVARPPAFKQIFCFDIELPPRMREGRCPIPYQEALAQAVAQHYNAAFISLDPWDMLMETTLPADTVPRRSGVQRGRRRRRISESSGKASGKTAARVSPDLIPKNDEPVPRACCTVSLVFDAIDALEAVDKSTPVVIFVRGLKGWQGLMADLENELASHSKAGRNSVVIGSWESRSPLPKDFNRVTTIDWDGEDMGFSDSDDGLVEYDDTLGDSPYVWRQTQESDDLKPMKTHIYPITLPLPANAAALGTFMQQLSDSYHIIPTRDNHRRLAEAISKAGVEHEPLGSVKGLEMCQLVGMDATKVVNCAVSYALARQTDNATPANDLDRVVLTPGDVQRAVDLLLHGDLCCKRNDQGESANFNKYEAKLKPNLVTPGTLPFKFENIGALDHVKKSLKELITLPLCRPELFSTGLLAKPVSGILLFGPPGTGKTMLAKAVAAESGSNFLHVSLSDIMDMYVGQGEKNAKAVFTLARKFSPCVVFLDEVDSLLERRVSGEKSYKREVLNEFMAEWDGLSGDSSRVIVLAATNRPYDLDDAVLRRLPRRLMVELPDQRARKQILQVLLHEEKLAADVDLDNLASITPKYSGSDLKNLCMAAALNSVKEALAAEETSNTKADQPPELHLQHFIAAKEEVKSSAIGNQDGIDRLQEWNARYGMGSKPHRTHMGFGGPQPEVM